MENTDLRITKIILENIRCFEYAEIDCKATALGVILGDNGVGKSTLLKSIALGLSSPKTTLGLFEQGGMPWLRRGAQSGRIRLEFNNGDASESTIRLETYGEILSPGGSPWELEHEQVLVCGYGAARRAFGDKSYSSYSLREAVGTLFDYDAKLQNPELILRRLLPPDGDSHRVLSWLDKILLLPDGSVQLKPTGLEINGPWGDFTPVGALSDGYRATLAWLLDFLGWVMYFNPAMLTSGVRGIVLVDEIEQHLHPLWQRQIYQLLTKMFPDVQFITTTHSPLCVIGTTDLADKDVSLIHLQRRGDAVEAVSGLQPPRGMRADQVLTSFLFGLETTGDNQTKFEVERLAKLLSQPERTTAEADEVERLRQSLNGKLGSDETELGRQVERAAKNATEQQFEKLLNSSQPAVRSFNLASSAVDFEIKRQLKELLK